MEQKQHFSAYADAMRWTKILRIGIGAFHGLIFAGLLMFVYFKFFAK